MAYSINNRILKVDLSRGAFEIEQKDEKFFRTYLGGGGIGAYYLLNETPAKIDAFDARNMIVFAPGVTTGSPAPGLPRFSVISRSPQTGRIGDSQAAGYWGPELKFAGFDAVTVSGKAATLSYLWIHDGKAEIRDARALKGLSPADATEAIRTELGDQKIRVAAIGLAGENLVRYANILNGSSANGRLGFGAVMGSKNLKAIAVRGNTKLKMADLQKVIDLAKWFADNYKDNPDNYGLSTLGTEYVTALLQHGGQLPTRNFQAGVFEGSAGITAEEFQRYAEARPNCCYSCPVGCRKHLKGGTRGLEAKYGAPEYEGVAGFGSNCGIGDTEVVAKANQLCNEYGMDVVSSSASIAFAMECFEKGLIKESDADGTTLRFGESEAMLGLLPKIAKREGFGRLLGEGVRRAANALGRGTEAYAIEAKGQELPMHDARAKGMVGFGYMVYGADHVIVEHDSDFDEHAPELYMEQIKCMSLYDRISSPGMTPYKVKMFSYLQFQWSFFDALGVCVHAYAPIRTFKMRDLVQLVDAATGWETSLWELMKAGERRVNLFKLFNLREGFGAEDDVLPERFFMDAIPSGPLAGTIADRSEFERARTLYYGMLGWDEKSSMPSEAKLIELDLDWALARF